MDRKFKWVGYWWLPGSDKKLHGTLRFTSEKEAILEVDGSFVNISQALQGEMLNPDIILGFSRDGKKITLCRCFQKNFQMSFPGSAFSSFLVEKVFIGDHFQKVEDIKFKKLSVRYSYLDEWVGISGFNIDEKVKEVVVKYRIPDPIQVDISRDCRVMISFRREGPTWGRVLREICIRERAEIDVEFSRERTFDECLKVIGCIQRFLSLGIGEPVRPLYVIGQTKKQMEEKIPRTEIFYRDIVKVSKRSDPQRMLFTFNDIKDNFEFLLKRWFEKEKSLRDIYDLYFAELYNPHLYIENSFLNFVQALETYHRRVYRGKDKYIDDDEYNEVREKLIGAIPENVDKDLKNRLKDYLEFGNEFSLRRRLNDLFDKYQKILKSFIEENKKDFIQKVVVTRNYYVHYDEKNKRNIARGKTLYQLTEKLKIWLITCILSELGFTQEKIKKMLEKHIR